MPRPTDCSEFTAAALLPALIEAFRERGVDRLPTDEIVAALGERHGRVRLCYALRIMCGRYRQARDPREVAEFFETVNPLPNRPPRWNIAPTQDALVSRDGRLLLCARRGSGPPLRIPLQLARKKRCRALATR